MDTRSGRVFVAVLALLVAGGVVMPVALADSHEYRISVEGSVPIPEQTRQIDEEGVEGEFIFNAVKAVDPGDQLTVKVDGIPDRDDPQLILKKLADGDTLQSRGAPEYLDGEGTVTYDIPEHLSPGLYFLAVETSSIESLYPIIIQEYHVDVDWETVPNAAESGSEISVSAKITRSANPEDRQRVKYVDVVIANEETLHNETLTLDRDSVTETSFTVSGTVTINEDLLPPGDDYSVYIAARGPETLEGLRVPVGISEQRTFEVMEPSTPTSTPTTTPTPPPTTTATPPSTTTSTSPSTTTSTSPSTTVPDERTSSSTTTASETSTETDGTGALPTLQPPTGTLKPGDESTPTATEGGILTPGVTDTENPGGETTTDGQPGFSVAVAVLTILLAAASLRRR